MRIIRATEPIPVDHPVFLIFGQPGIFKTSLGYSASAPLTLDFDKGAHRAANRRDTLAIESWADVAELVATPAALEPYSTIVVDTVGRCLDVLTADIIRETPKLGPNGNLSQQGWGVLKNRFRTWVATLRTLGKDVLLIAHDKEDKDGDVRVVRPDIVGGSFGEVMKIADFIAYGYMSGKDRVLDFNPTDRWIGKNPAGWAPFKVPPVAKAQTFMAELLDQGRAALGQISDVSAAAVRQVEAWRERITSCSTAAQCNACIPEIKQLSTLLQPQVSKLLMDWAKSAGIPFDAGQKLFVEPAKTAPAAAPTPTLAGAGTGSMF
jgi:hypothetical protein